MVRATPWVWHFSRRRPSLVLSARVRRRVNKILVFEWKWKVCTDPWRLKPNMYKWKGKKYGRLSKMHYLQVFQSLLEALVKWINQMTDCFTYPSIPSSPIHPSVHPSIHPSIGHLVTHSYKTRSQFAEEVITAAVEKMTTGPLLVQHLWKSYGNPMKYWEPMKLLWNIFHSPMKLHVHRPMKKTVLWNDSRTLWKNVVR